MGQNLAASQWFKSALATKTGAQFGFESVHRSNLVKDQLALVYSCTVRAGGRIDGRPLGVLGIVFAWEALGQAVIDRTPLSEQEWAQTRVCIVDNSGTLLADSAGKVLHTLEFAGWEQLFTEPRGAATAEVDAEPMRIAHAASLGFETYRTGWHSLLMRRCG